MELRIPDKTMVCLAYPGVIVNPDKALRTLGGLRNLRKTLSDSTKRIPLLFRPDDQYCKPVYGDRVQSTSLLLRVRRRKNNNNNNGDNNNNNNNHNNTIIGEIIGVMDMSVVFKSLCDFQYLPMERQYTSKQSIHFPPTLPPILSPIPPLPPILSPILSPTPHHSSTLPPTLQSHKNLKPTQSTFPHSPHEFSPILDDINHPTEEKVVTYRSLKNNLFLDKNLPRQWLDPPVPHTEDPLFLIPPSFSRYDQPYLYCFRDVQNTKKFSFPENCIGISRSRRPQFTTVLKFSSTHLPTIPYAEILDKIGKAKLPEFKINRIKGAFSHKKVWTSLALYAEVGPEVNKNDIKLILPSLAYYYVDGPWRAMWVWFGYDCKRNAECKIYQNLDFRLERGIVTLYTGVKSQRATNNKIQSRVKVNQSKTITGSMGKDDDEDEENDENAGGGHDDDAGGEGSSVQGERNKFREDMEPSYIFKPGIMPRYKQIFYHLCHIHEPEVQRLVHLNDGQESFCSEKDGWCLPDTIEKCRAIINSYRKKVINKHIKDSGEVLTQRDDEDDDEEDDESYGDGNDPAYGDGNDVINELGFDYSVNEASVNKLNPSKGDNDNDNDEFGGDDDDDEYIPGLN